MKHILFLLLPLLPALALAQTGTVKDSVRVLTTAEISAGQASDTANFYFIQNGQWRKINMDSLDSFLRRKRAGDRGDIDVSTDGLTWTVDTNAIVAVDIQNGAVDSTKLALGAVLLPGAKVTGTLPVSKGGTGAISIAGARDTIRASAKCGAIVAGVWREFMCHNLGSANMGADPFTPSWEINGGYWQWGRKAQAAAGPTGSTSGQANSGAPGGWSNTDAANGSWADIAKTANDPCPAGFRIPTKAEWDSLIAFYNGGTPVGNWTAGTTNYTSGRMFGQNLFLPAAGYRSNGNGSLFDRGLYGFYWSSSEDGSNNARNLYFNSGGAFADVNGRAYGFSLRCISEIPENVGSEVIGTGYTSNAPPINGMIVEGNVGIGTATPGARLHLGTGQNATSGAPLKFTSGTLRTAASAEAGTMEYNSSAPFLYFTPTEGNRRVVALGLIGSLELDFGNTSQQSSADLTISVTGAAEGDIVSLGVPNAAVNANTCYTAWVSAADTVTVRFNNYSSGSVNPTSATFKVYVHKN